MTLKQLLALLNVTARTEFNRKYQETDPKFKNIAYEYECGPVASTNFVFQDFLNGMEEFTGRRKHTLFPDGHKFSVTNKEYDMAVDILRADAERAALINSIQPLNMKTQRIGEMGAAAKDHPFRHFFKMLEAGEANTYGTCFDAQNLFDTTHDFSTAAGTQSNIVTGTGVTTATLHADFLSVLAAFDSFYYQQSGGTDTSDREKLNQTTENILIVAPTQLSAKFRDLQLKDFLSTGESNTVKGMFALHTRPFADSENWYALLLDDAIMRPFLLQIEKRPELDFPEDNTYFMHELKKLVYGAYGRYAMAYGAWWKAVKVINA